jgi:hypothetical protein
METDLSKSRASALLQEKMKALRSSGNNEDVAIVREK